MADWIGRTVSKVEIQKLLGRGGMAEVYQGRHTTLDRQVAVKVLQSHLSEDVNLLSRFKDEARSVANMRHPNIVQVFDFDVVDDRPFIVMELLDGLSLRDYLISLNASGQKIPPRTVVRLISNLSAALDYAHSRGIVHRDIKPANIMLRSEAGPITPGAPLPADVEPILTDFGVARITNATAHTASGTIIGTPAYMSPEQVRGSVIDARSDIYSLGIVLYEMLAGRVPFSSETQASVLLMQINDPPPLLPAEYAELQPVLDRALAKDPNQRFQKASDLSAVLAASLGYPGDTSTTEPRARELVPPFHNDDAFTVRLEPPTGAGVPRADTPTSSGPMPVANTTTIQPPSGINPLWIAAGIAGLALIVGAIALGIALAGGRGPLAGSPTQPAGTPQQAQTVEASLGTGTAAPAGGTAAPVAGTTVGSVLFKEDALSATLDGLANVPDGSFYQAWLTGPNDQLQSLGKLEVFNGKTSIQFKSSDGQTLLPRFTGFEVSVEQGSDVAIRPGHVVYSGQLDPQILKDLTQAVQAAPNQPVEKTILDGIRSQSKVYNSHLQFIIDAINAANLAGIKQHSEHVINITVGKGDQRYGDYTGDKVAQNPGNGVGLETYLRLLKQSISATANAPDADAGVRAAANDQTKTIDDVTATLEATVTAATGLTAADTADEAKASEPALTADLLGDKLNNLADDAAKLDLGLAIQVQSVSP